MKPVATTYNSITTESRKALVRAHFPAPFLCRGFECVYSASPMKRRYICGVWIVLFLVSGCTHRAAAPGETRSIEPTKQTIAILSWDLPHWSAESCCDPQHGLTSLEQIGFNTAAFVRPQHLKQVEQLGMQCIFAAQDFPIPWRTMSDQQIDAAVKKMVDEAHGSAAVMGYFLADEPGEPDFAALGKAVAAVKKYAPGKLGYINLFPDYATLGAPNLSQLGTADYTEYLEQFVAQVNPQFISYDNYRIEFSADQRDPATAASYYNNLLAVRRVAMKHALPFWNIVSSNRITPSTTIPSPANLALQAYTTLAAGAKGLTWYTYYATGYLYSPIDKDGNRTSTWSQLKMVNDQVKVLGPILQPLKSTGVYFTSPSPATSLPALPGELVETAACATPLMVGEFSGSEGERYAMIVNLSLRDSAQFKLTLHDAKSDIRQISPADGSLMPLEPGNAVWLAAGQGVLLKWLQPK